MSQKRTALITGASRGLGKELAKALHQRGFALVLVARGEQELQEVANELGPDVLPIAADVAKDSEIIAQKVQARFGALDVLVNNASTVGPSPMPALADYPWEELAHLFGVNTLAPLHLTQLVLPFLAAEGVILNISSDAGVNIYEGWGGYGASKAALEHLSETLAKETGRRVYVIDPGEMNTRMHQQAEPGVDLSHLPGPEAPVPFLLHLIEKAPKGFARFQAQQEGALL